MSILSCSPLSPSIKENELVKESPTFSALLGPLEACLPHLTPLESGSNRPLTYTFAHQIRGLVYYHTEACTSVQDLLFAAKCDLSACNAQAGGFVNLLLVPPSGLGESTFYEANASRGSTQIFCW